MGQQTPTADIRQTKARMRRLLIEERRSLSPESRRQKSQRIWQRCRSLPSFPGSHVLCCYIGCGEEVETARELRTLLREGRRVAVPTLRAKGGSPSFAKIRSWEELSPNSLGILEPSSEALRIIPTAEIPLFFVPGIGFDERGRRLGYGLGFYDRALARASRDAVLVGLAFDLQVVESVPVVEHDHPMDIVITEQRVIAPSPVAGCTEEVC